MMIGTITILITLWSTMPMPVKSTVTTQQMVSTMKRGENGVSSVSQTFAIAYPPWPQVLLPLAYIIRLRCYGKMAGAVTGSSGCFAVQQGCPLTSPRRGEVDAHRQMRGG